ncbi:MAG TPA: glycosyltransferase family 87 protein [Candidatus Eisenbacteria bacterium]|nr:glycosyltransferase family 87 protein [Candidatus Eisenbacteria bacterium]
MNKSIIAWIFFLGIFGYTLYSAIRISTTFAPDFSIFYYSAKDLLLGISPYLDKSLFTIFNYPLASSALFIPFTIFPYRIAQTLFIFSNVISVFFLVYFALTLIKKHVSISFFLVIVSLLFLSFPTKFTMGMGQTNVIAYLLLLAGFLMLQKKKSVWTIIFLTISIFLKPVLGLSLVLLLFEKEWKLFLITLGSILFFVIAVPFIFHQPLANALFVQNVLGQSMTGREVYYNQGLLGFISRLIQDLQLRYVFNLFLTLLLIFLTFWRMRTTTITTQLSFILTVLVIIDPLSWQHHFVFLFFPFLATFFAIQKQKRKKALLYSLLALSYILVSVNIKNPLQIQDFPISLILSHQFYGVMLLYILEFVVF